MISYLKNFKQKILELFHKYNPLTLGALVDDIKKDTSSIIEKLNKEDFQISKLEKQLQVARRERDLFDRLIYHIGETIPDMIWHKDINGRYKYVNNAIREGLFYDLPEHEIIGFNDIEIALKCKNLVGDDKHTFGEICGNSDVQILKYLKKDKFLENGKIDGEEVYLEVHKAPMYNKEGELVGTVGTGRDVTEFYLGLVNAINSIEKCGDCNKKDFVEEILKELNKYRFEG